MDQSPVRRRLVGISGRNLLLGVGIRVTQKVWILGNAGFEPKNSLSGFQMLESKNSPRESK
jgi:hypothetical protein